MGNRERDFLIAIKEIVATYGKTAISDIQRMNALLMDYAPGQARERKLIISALEEGIGTDLIRGIDQTETERELCFNRCVKHLIAESWITEEAAQFAVHAIAEAVEFDISHLPGPNSKAPKPQEKELEKGACPSGVDISSALLGCAVIGYKAFAANTNLTEVVVPNGVKKIKSKAFVDCVKLKRIALPSSIEEIGKEAFAGCDALETVDIERNPHYGVVAGLVIDKKQKALMRATRQINSICIIPNEIETIHARAFERSEVQEVTIPRSLKSFNADSVRLCGKLRQFNTDGSNPRFSTIGGVLHTKDRSALVRFPTGYAGASYIMEETVVHIETGAFSGSANLETITFTSSLKTIGPRAFEICPKLSSLLISSSVEIIGERAFQYCDKLASVMLPRSIQEIGDYAFCGCTSIKTISIPRAVTRIGHSAFKDCSHLEKIIIQDGVTFIGDGAFAGCAGNLEVVIKDNSYVKQYCGAHKITWSEL